MITAVYNLLFAYGTVVELAIISVGTVELSVIDVTLFLGDLE